MDDELEKQLARIETTVADLLKAVKNLHAGPFGAGEINDRLKRFLARKSEDGGSASRR